jgi:hypothetical protein
MQQRLKEILKQVADIGQLVEQIKGEGPVPSIEVDIILEKIRKLYDITRRLEDIPVVMSPSPVVEADEKPDSQKEMAIESEKQDPEEAPGQSTEISSKHIEPEELPDKESDKAEPEILADKYLRERKYINETLSPNSNKQDITSKLVSKPIKSIKSSIGINDRYKLINELFNGDQESFENSVLILDEANNFNEAFTFLNTSFDWDMEDEAVQILLDLVRRKFIVNQDE